uniref:Uncharacterized protein n=1 Tax=Utricularia reniformis TaxID=192314 RepID=A0A1Y0AYQ7_9LAMI|nr:hypothetical protein AEK19_MT0385 [Utricularia reniformis]ART30277.1 hypothetical protein AEK19_MT0385 [Utricularia reniformis]
MDVNLSLSSIDRSAESLQSRDTLSHPHKIGNFYHPGDKEKEGMQIESIDLNRHEMNSSMRPNSKSKVN